MGNEVKKYICINCGGEVKSLFKKYSESVLKLTECEICNKVADKYVEYDIVIIMIDLVLLQKIAYRHILFNIELENFWKLSIILLLMESYSEWVHNSPTTHYSQQLSSNNSSNSNTTEIPDKPYLDKVNVDLTDFEFYSICLAVTLKMAYYILVLYILTLIYCTVFRKNLVTYKMIWKTSTVSSFGIFLLFPSLIWDTSVQEFHLSVVVLYTTLSQLLAYTVLCNCPKIWSVVAVFSALYCKSFHFEYFELPYLNTVIVL